MIIVNDSLLVKCRSTLLIEMIKFQDIGLFFGFNIAAIDLPHPAQSDGNNLLHLVNKYMDEYRGDEHNRAAKAKAEKYARIVAKININSSGDSANYGQRAFFMMRRRDCSPL